MRSETRPLKGLFLLDTKPLTKLLFECIGLEDEILAPALARLGLKLASVWPVFTETLYFISKRLRGRYDKTLLIHELRKCLDKISELPAAFHDVLGMLDEELEIADATLLYVLQNTLATLISEDSKLVGKARKKGLQAVTLYEFLSLIG